MEYSAAFLQYVSFLLEYVDPVSVCLRDLVVILNDHLNDSVDPRFLNFHLRSELLDSAVLQEEEEEEVQQAVVVGKHATMNVDVVAHVTWIFHIFWNELPVQLMVVVQLMMMNEG